MSTRVYKQPIAIPAGVEVKVENSNVSVKGKHGELNFELLNGINVTLEGSELKVAPASNDHNAMAGTTRSILNNNVKGVAEGFVKQLKLIGVGYRVAVDGSGKKATFTVGYSHPVEVVAPEGITFKAPAQTDFEIFGACKQAVGQVAATVRAIRPPEPYKGKGIRYADEQISLKETKKK